VKWRQVRADAKQNGRVNLYKLLTPNQQVVAYGSAGIESTAARDAVLQVGSDDTITIWLGGKKVHDHQGDRGWASNQDRVHVKLDKGANRLLIQCGNSREELMTSVLEPSKVIAQGYEPIVITTTAGKTLTGVFKGESGEAVSLVDAEGKMHTVAKKEIGERSFSPVSQMPNGLSDGMTLQDFAAVIAFLEARREEKPAPGK
jgi:putative heme-binding domain-containing protein